MFVLIFSSEVVVASYAVELALNFLQTTRFQVIVYILACTTHLACVGALQGIVRALWQVCIDHLLVNAFEAAVLAGVRSPSALLNHMLFHVVLRDYLRKELLLLL